MHQKSQSQIASDLARHFGSEIAARNYNHSTSCRKRGQAKEGRPLTFFFGHFLVTFFSFFGSLFAYPPLPGSPMGKMLVHTGMQPVLSLASNYANSYLVSSSFWMLTTPWILYPAFQTKVAHLCFCLVRIKIPLLTCFHTSLILLAVLINH